ncbi:hypothetical protein QJS10_CPB22g00804 [Acorus calamus]|uniref:Reverse transcriptase domain-containing protein n=1 Tax=Acorus calamus TaxID=4465 RepID=A0AAV9BYB1_ACOCL|nr:hypothetical protein QJS10_CPB22g00804 [Acorus calamus]
MSMQIGDKRGSEESFDFVFLLSGGGFRRDNKVEKAIEVAMCNFQTIKDAADVTIATMLSGIQDVCVPLSRPGECISRSKQLLDASPLVWYIDALVTWLIGFLGSGIVQDENSIVQVLSDHSMLKAWELHPHFEQLISTSWSKSFNGSPMFVLVMKLKHLKGVLKQWNKDTFGMVQSSLQHSRSCLEQAQVASLQAPLDSSLSEIESIARDSYLHTLRIEESLLRQKSRQTWLREGDKNSKFFYSSIKSRIAQNCIRNVTLEDGSIVCEPNQVKQYAIHYFESLLNRQHHSVIPDLAPSVTLREDDRHQLNKPVSAEEVRLALFSMKPLSSPGPDGFSARFFQHFWHIIKEDFISAICSFFHSGFLLRQINHSFISLIPKTKHADSFDCFRPISLCNTIYKVITKILASRLQKVLPHAILPHRSAFIKGRNIVHNSLLAHELTRYLNAPSLNGRSCIKIDLKKAFDSVRWDFLEKVMQSLLFPEEWIRLVMQCIQTASYSVLINGSPAGFFSATCGLRQGDPLSPLLFVLVMNALKGSKTRLWQEGWEDSSTQS